VIRLNAATVERLPRYFQILRALRARGREYVSSEHLARLLKVDPSLVRKDLAWMDSGLQKVGYHVASTLEKIEGVLGMHNTKEAFLVGAGSLGRALMGYRGFSEYGLKILAAFDIDEWKVGGTVGGIEVLPMSKFADLVRRLNVRIGIVTVPAEAAQAVADEMVTAGVVAIWNFAPVTLDVPDNVVVRNENLAAGFALLSYELERALNIRRSETASGDDGIEN